MKKCSVALITLLVFSAGINVFLFKCVVDWQNASVDQILATYNIEKLYINSGADISLSAVEKIASEKIGITKIIDVSDLDDFNSGIDSIGIETDGTILVFKNGLYAGSKSRISEDLSHWGFGVGIF